MLHVTGVVASFLVRWQTEVIIENELANSYVAIRVEKRWLRRPPTYVGINVYTRVYVFRIAPVPECKTADWGVSLDKQGWSECPQTNKYLKGLWRHDSIPGDERVGRIEFGRCCEADEPCYTLQPATCSNANWTTLLDG